MRKYKLAWQAHDCISWEYDFEIVSDRMAILFARNQMRILRHCPLVHGLILYGFDPGRVVAEFKLLLPEVEVIDLNKVIDLNRSRAKRIRRHR